MPADTVAAILRRAAKSDFANRFWARTKPTDDGCVVWTGARLRAGYGRVQFEGRLELTHRVAVLLDGQAIPPGSVVAHVCDNPPCVNPKHLRVTSAKENTADMIQKSRSGWQKDPARFVALGKRMSPPRFWGAANHFAKLEQATVLRIRAQRKSGATYRQLMQSFALPKTTIADICRERTWPAAEVAALLRKAANAAERSEG